MRRQFPALALAVLAAACAHYQAKPISPAESADALAARSLRDPGLAEFFAANYEPVPAPDAPWGLRALTLAAFYFSPDLDVARAELAAAQAGRITAAGRENPAAAASVGRGQAEALHLVSPWILSFNLEIPLTTAGKRAHRMAEAAGLAEAARFRLASVAWGVRSRVRAGLVDVFAAREGEALLAKQEAILERNAGLLDRQLAAGEISAFEASQGHQALTTARLAKQDATARLTAARGRLAAALGLPVAALADVTLSYGELAKTDTVIPPDAARREALTNRADVLAALAEYDASQAALALEIARQYPDIHLGPGYEYDQGDNKWFLALSLPLPVVNRNRGPIAEAEANREAAAARLVAVQAAAMTQIDQAVRGYQAAQRAFTTASALEGELTRQQQAAEKRFTVGEISRLELGTVESELVAGELARLDAQVKAEAALGALEDAMQSSAEPLRWLANRPQRSDAGPGR